MNLLSIIITGKRLTQVCLQETHENKGNKLI